MGNTIRSDSGAAEQNASDISAEIGKLDGTVTSGMTVTNTNVRGNVSGVNARSETAMSALKAAIRQDINNIRTLSDEFEEFDAMIAATELLSGILHD